MSTVSPLPFGPGGEILVTEPSDQLFEACDATLDIATNNRLQYN